MEMKLCNWWSWFLSSYTWMVNLHLDHYFGGFWYAASLFSMSLLNILNAEILWLPLHVVKLSLFYVAGKRRYDRKQSGYGGQTKPVFHKKVSCLLFCFWARSIAHASCLGRLLYLFDGTIAPWISKLQIFLSQLQSLALPCVEKYGSWMCAG